MLNFILQFIISAWFYSGWSTYALVKHFIALYVAYICSSYQRVKEKIVETVSFRCMYTFISHSLCILLKWVGYMHMANSQTINIFCIFKLYVFLIYASICYTHIKSRIKQLVNQNMTETCISLYIRFEVYFIIVPLAKMHSNQLEQMM